MLDEFTVDLRTQREWGWLIVLAFFFSGVGAGTFLVSWQLRMTPGMILGIVVVAVGTNGALLLDLGRIDRFWRVFSQPLTSWISRGSILITAFVVFGALHLLPRFAWFAWLPWSPETLLSQATGYLAALFAFGVAIYAGFVMSYSPSIPFWNTTLLPVLFVSYALAGGTAAIVAVLPGEVAARQAVATVETLVIVLLLASLVLVAVYVATMFYSTSAAKAAVQMLVGGSLAPVFLGGVVFMGLLVPLFVTVYLVSTGASAESSGAMLALAAILELFGGLLMRYCIVKAGIYGQVA